MSVSHRFGSKFLFYPRTYNKRGDESMHSMVGMTESHDIINVKLRVPEKHKGKETTPSIVEFSRDDYRAKMPCIPSDQNGPDCPEGILLLSGCQKEGHDDNRKMDVYTARWADVIASDHLSPGYYSGLSRMLIQPYSNQVIKLRSLLSKAKSNGDHKEAERIQDQIDSPENWSYPVIMYYPGQMMIHGIEDRDLIHDCGARMIDSFLSNGVTGGVAIRAVDEQGQVFEESYEEHYCFYIAGENRLQTGDEVMESLLKEDNPQWSWANRSGVSVEIFPIAKINSGPVANRIYSRESNYDFVERYFYKDDRPRVCQGIVRVSYNEDANLTLLSKYFARSKPIGDPARIGRSGRLSRMFVGELPKLAYREDTEKVIFDGIQDIMHFQNRAMWLLENPDTETQSITSEEGTDSRVEGVSDKEIPDDSSEAEGEDVVELSIEDLDEPESQSGEEMTGEEANKTDKESEGDRIDVNFDEDEDVPSTDFKTTSLSESDYLSSTDIDSGVETDLPEDDSSGSGREDEPSKPADGAKTEAIGLAGFLKRK